MLKQKKLLSILKNKSGASMVFALCIMLVLMSVGVALLVATSSSDSTVRSRKEYNKLTIYSDDIQKNIMYSLQHDEFNRNFMSAQIAKALYEANDIENAAYNITGLSQFELDMTVDGGVDLSKNGVIIESIIVTFPKQDVTIIPFVDEIPAIDEVRDEDGNIIVEGKPIIPREPKTALVSATMNVVVKLKMNDKKMITRSVYEFSNCKFIDDVNGDGVADVNPDGTLKMSFALNGSGEWRLISYEKIDS